jgi:hypothetical protein
MAPPAASPRGHTPDAHVGARMAQERVFSGAGIAFTPLGKTTPASWAASRSVNGSAIATPLPANVGLVTLQVPPAPRVALVA